jgi:hypothetical protein
MPVAIMQHFCIKVADNIGPFAQAQLTKVHGLSSKLRQRLYQYDYRNLTTPI